MVPILVTTTLDPGEARAIVSAALDGSPVDVVLKAPPTRAEIHWLEVHVGGWARPLTLLAELLFDPTGKTLGGAFPLLVRPFNSGHEARLRAFLAGGARGIPPEIPGAPFQPSVVATEDEPTRPIVRVAVTEAATVPTTRIPGGSGRRVGEPGQAAGARNPTPPSTSPAPDPLVGRVLGGGKYEVQSRLAQGGVGRVYQGRHVTLDTPVAVKVLRRDSGSEAEARRFLREARAAGRIDHPNAVRVIDFGAEPDGLLYIVMELLTGTTLRRILRSGPRMPLESIVDLMAQTCAALSAAHDQGIVHRDIKPENILVVPRCSDEGDTVDAVKVCDFGLAWLQNPRGDSGGRLTGAGVICGTPRYMSPEQVMGLAVDARTDVYACGVVLYELATGQVPFALDSDNATLLAQVNTPPRPPSVFASTVAPGLEAIILKALSKTMAQRQQTARELRSSLLDLLPPDTQVRRAAVFRRSTVIPPAAPPADPPVQDDSGQRCGVFQATNALLGLGNKREN